MTLPWARWRCTSGMFCGGCARVERKREGERWREEEHLRQSSIDGFSSTDGFSWFSAFCSRGAWPTDAAASACVEMRLDRKKRLQCIYFTDSKLREGVSEGAACRSFFFAAAGRRRALKRRRRRRLSFFLVLLFEITSLTLFLNLKTQNPKPQLRHVRPPRRGLRGTLWPHRARRSGVQPLGLRVRDGLLLLLLLLLPCFSLHAESLLLRSLSPRTFLSSLSLSLSLCEPQDSLQAPQVHLPPLLPVPHESRGG